MVLAAEGRKANDSHADCYQYFCVPEYGTANGRLHFHAVHLMRTLPTAIVDPNFGRPVRNRRKLNSLQNTWTYGYSMTIAVRYTQAAFSRSGWFFFSSRRRHTILQGDWSSDVCSSDLSMKPSLAPLTQTEIGSMSKQLRVKPEEVAEMEMRLAGREISLEPASDEDEPYAPIAYLADRAPGPSEIAHPQQDESLRARGLETALASLESRSR